MDNSEHSTSADLVGTTTGILVLTDDSSEPSIAVARGVAARLAERNHVSLTLYDRAEETWTAPPHGEGPIELGDERLADRPVLSRQMREAEARGAHPLGWIASLPAISSVESALVSVGADVVVVPKNMAPRLLERALQARSIAEMIATRIEREPHLDARVLEVAGDGSVALACAV